MIARRERERGRGRYPAREKPRRTHTNEYLCAAKREKESEAREHRVERTSYRPQKPGVVR